MHAHHRQTNKNLMHSGMARGVVLYLSSRGYPYHTPMRFSMRAFTDVAPPFRVEHPRPLMSSTAPAELRRSLFFSSSFPRNLFLSSSSCFQALHFSRRSFFISKKKVRTQLSAMKHEAENARKNAKEDVEKAKRYGIRSFGLDMLDVADTLEKGIEAFERHRQRFGDRQGPATPPPPTTAGDSESNPHHTTTTTTSNADACDGEREISSNASQMDSLRADNSNSESNDNSRSLHNETDTNEPNTSNSHKAEEKSLESIFTGMQLSMRVLQKHLRRHGIEKIPVQCGEKFDPSIHDAVSGVPASSKMPEETIAVLLKNGYKIKERVLRPAQVAVVVKDQEKDDKKSS